MEPPDFGIELRIEGNFSVLKPSDIRVATRNDGSRWRPLDIEVVSPKIGDDFGATRHQNCVQKGDRLAIKREVSQCALTFLRDRFHRPRREITGSIE